MTDAELLAACRQGERAAFGQLVERYQSLICAISYSSTGDRTLSEDVAQETFLAAWRQLDQLREPGKLRSWMCGIARNLGRKARRRRRREIPAAQPEATAAEVISPFEQTADAEAEKLVRDALERIPPRYREVLVLYYREQRSAREVAELLGISEDAAMQRLSRGRRHLHRGVTDLVERSLATSGPRRSLAGAVLASLPLTPPRVVTNHHGGWKMFKIAAVVGALAVTGGTTAYLVTQTGDAPDPRAEAAAAAPPAATAAAGSARSAPATASARPGPRPERPTLAPAPGITQAPEPDDDPVIDSATFTRLKLGQGPGRGPATAPVTIVVFTDFMCPFCNKVVGTVDELWDEYPDKLRLVIKQMPVHQEARLAAEAALAADEQGRFWELHDLMMTNQDDLSRNALLAYGKQAGLDVDRFRRDLDRHTFADQVAADQAAAAELEIRGTPSFLINGRRFVGARPIDQFRDMIEKALTD